MVVSIVKSYRYNFKIIDVADSFPVNSASGVCRRRQTIIVNSMDNRPPGLTVAKTPPNQNKSVMSLTFSRMSVMVYFNRVKIPGLQMRLAYLLAIKNDFFFGYVCDLFVRVRI